MAIKILFQGDSITDAGRDRSNPHDMGPGYPKYASAMIADSYPDIEFEFINLGISGNRSGQLLARADADLIELQPDVVSILIGVNDVWHRHSVNIATSDEEFESNYRTLLERIKSETNAKILMMSPYLLDTTPDKESWREEIDRVIAIVRRLAAEFADYYLPLDEVFAEALKTEPAPFFYSNDGIHPNVEGACFIGEQYLKAVTPLLDQWMEKQ